MRKKHFALTLAAFAVIFGCNKKSELAPSSPKLNTEIENIDAANSMKTALSKMLVYHDSFVHHSGTKAHHYDNMFHHHDSLFIHHHQIYHHNDTSHHHPTGLHNETQHHQHDSVALAHHSIAH
jgi:hypothetical protein